MEPAYDTLRHGAVERIFLLVAPGGFAQGVEQHLRVCRQQRPELAAHANALAQVLARVGGVTKAAWATGEPAQALANAVPYMQAFGHTVLAWTWLDLSLKVDAIENEALAAGVAGATTYFFHYELPRAEPWLRVVEQRDMTCAQLPVEAF